MKLKLILLGSKNVISCLFSLSKQSEMKQLELVSGPITCLIKYMTTNLTALKRLVVVEARFFLWLWQPFCLHTRHFLKKKVLYVGGGEPISVAWHFSHLIFSFYILYLKFFGKFFSSKMSLVCYADCCWCPVDFHFRCRHRWLQESGLLFL